MVGMVGWTSGYTFPIYAVGDGLFMSRVMNAIAALSNSGVLASLGLLGLLLGLLAVSMRAIGSGGRQVELPSLFLSFIMYGVMFGGTASVSIQEVAQPPGIFGPRVYNVDNVPFGVAAMGWVVSNVSYALTEKLEQAYGLPEDTNQDVLSVGFNRTLDWLTAGRMMEQPDFGDTSTAVGRFRWDLVSYLRFCTPKALDVNQGRLPLMAHASDPYDTLSGIGFASSWDTFPYLDLTTTSGDPLDKTCGEGIGLIKTYSQGKFRADAEGAVAVPMGYSGSDSPQNQADAAWSAMGASLDAAGQFYANHMIRGAMNEALAGVPIAGDMQVANALMVDTAEAQRAAKFAGEESLWRRMVRPMMAFFESLIYIAAPFMALMVGLGGMGVKMVGRYSLATIWVSMWLPTLAAINMYQETMAQEFFSPFVNGTKNGVTDHSLTSLYGSAHLYSQLDDLIATGSLLVASTPAITAFLLFGSAYALNSLWSGMAGGEFVNQKTATPDAVNTPAALERSALQKHDQVSGNSIAGAAANPSIRFGAGESAGETATMRAMDTSMTKYTQSMGMKAGEVATSAFQQGGRVSNTHGVNTSAGVQQLRSALDSMGVDTSHMSNFQLQVASAVAAGHDWSGTVSASSVGSLIAAIASDGASSGAGAAGKAGGAEKELTRMGKGSVSGDGGYSMHKGAEDKDTTSASDTTALAVKIASGLSGNTALQAAVMGVNQDSVQSFAQQGYSDAKSLSNSSDFSKARSDVSQISHAYAQEQKQTASVASSQDVDPVKAFGTIAGSPENARATADNLTKMYGQDYHGDMRDVESFKQGFKQRGYDDAHAQGAAVLMAMHDRPAGLDPSADNPNRAQMRGALVSMLASSGVLMVNTGSVGSSVGPERHGEGREAESNAGSAKKDVGAQHVGASVSSVKGAVASAASTSPTASADAAARKGGMESTKANADGGGGYAAGMKGDGVSINQNTFNREKQKIDDQATTNMQNLHDSKLAAIKPQVEQLVGNDANNGVTRDGRAQTLSDSMSENWKNSSANVQGNTFGEMTLSKGQAMHGLDANGHPSPRVDNTQLGKFVGAVGSGQFTHGVPQSNDFATVAGAVLATHFTGQALSAKQGEQVKAAENRLSPNQKQALNDIVHDISREHAMPGSPKELLSGSANEQLPTGSPPKPVASVTYGGDGPTPVPVELPKGMIDAKYNQGGFDPEGAGAKVHTRPPAAAPLPDPAAVNKERSDAYKTGVE